MFSTLKLIIKTFTTVRGFLKDKAEEAAEKTFDELDSVAKDAKARREALSKARHEATAKAGEFAEDTRTRLERVLDEVQEASSGKLDEARVAVRQSSHTAHQELVDASKKAVKKAESSKKKLCCKKNKNSKKKNPLFKILLLLAAIGGSVWFFFGAKKETKAADSAPTVNPDADGRLVYSTEHPEKNDQDLLDSLDDKTEDFKDKFDEIKDKADDFLDDAEKKLHTFTDSAKDKAEDLKDKAEDKLDDAKDKAEKKADDAVPAPGESEAADVIRDWIDEDKKN